MSRALSAQLGDLRVSREAHYKHHQFIEDWMDWMDTIKNSFWKNLVGSLVKGVLLLLLLGYIAYMGIKH